MVDIAARIGISHSAALERLRRLRDEKIVAIAAVPSAAAIGRPLLFAVEASLERPGVYDREWLRSLPSMQWMVAFADEPTISMQSSVETVEGISHLLNVIRARPWVAAASATVALTAPDVDPVSAPVPPLDEIDRTLIAALSDDGRATYTALAQLVSRSVPSTRSRVLRMIETGAMRINTDVDRRALGLHHTSYVGLTISRPADDIRRELAGFDSVRLFTETVGKFDIAFEANCVDRYATAALVDKLLAVPGITRAVAREYGDVIIRTGRWF